MGAARKHNSRLAIGSTVYGIVKDLRADAASLAFPIPIASQREAIEAKTLLMAQLDDHLLPRLAELSTPAIVVVAGSTGTGKSTLINTLVGEEVTEAGIIRPTTTEPVLIVNELDTDLVAKSPIAKATRIVTGLNLPQGVALLDAPDLDSLREENRATARKLLEGADLWLFVTSSQRYGDALPWKTLLAAVKRGTSVAMILNRVPEESYEAVSADLRERLDQNGLGAAPLFVVPDQGPSHGLLTAHAVAEIHQWLVTLAGKDQAEQVIVATLKGALAALPPRLIELADATDEQVAAKKHIMVGARRLLVRTVQSIRGAVADFALLDGAARATWSLFASQAKLDRVLDRSGYAKGSTRLAATRSQAAQAATARFQEVLQSTGMDTVAQSREALKQGLASVDGGDLVDVASFPDRADDVQKALTVWVQDLYRRVRAFVSEHPSKQVVAAASKVSEPALAAITIAAVLGEPNALTIARQLLGNDYLEVVNKARTELADHYDRVVLGEYVHITGQLEDLGLEEGSSARIRVRLAELNQLR